MNESILINNIILGNMTSTWFSSEIILCFHFVFRWGVIIQKPIMGMVDDIVCDGHPQNMLELFGFRFF